MIKPAPADGERIARAIAEAESRTSGEIFCVLARRGATYHDVSLGWASAAALLAPLALIPLGFEPTWLPGMASGWQAAHLAAQSASIGAVIGAYAMLQAAIFLVVFILTSLKGVRRSVTPRAIRRERVRRAALQQFLAHGVHVTEARTGVLIFAALDEHQVEVIADKGIYEKVDDAVWAEAASVLAAEMKRGDAVEGFSRAIALCGEVLARHFPPSAQDRNEVPDKLVVI